MNNRKEKIKEFKAKKALEQKKLKDARKAKIEFEKKQAKKEAIKEKAKSIELANQLKEEQQKQKAEAKRKEAEEAAKLKAAQDSIKRDEAIALEKAKKLEEAKLLKEKLKRAEVAAIKAAAARKQKQDKLLEKRKKKGAKLLVKDNKREAKAREAEEERIRNTFIIKGSTDESAPVLQVKNITKKFGSFEALKGVSFEVARGERIGLIGGNGAGKTTVSEIIAGINKPTSGSVIYGFEFDETPKEGIGMQFQQSTYPSGLTVKDIISFARNLRKLDMTNKELIGLLRVFQMEDFYGRKVRSLSGGQRQKLNILLSIIHNPKLVILDELSTGLDISAREEIIDFTDDLLTANNMSAILISHHMAEIKALCTKVVVLDNGEVRDIRLVSDIEKEHGSLGAYSKKLISESNIRLMELERAKREAPELKKVEEKKAKNKKAGIKKAKKTREEKVKSAEAKKTATNKKRQATIKKNKAAKLKKEKEEAKAAQLREVQKAKALAKAKKAKAKEKAKQDKELAKKQQAQKVKEEQKAKAIEKANKQKAPKDAEKPKKAKGGK